MRAQPSCSLVLASTLVALTGAGAEAGGRACRARLAGVVTSAGHMGAPRAVHTATLLADGRVLIAGGMERNGVFLSSAEIYDPTTGRFTPTGALTARRTGHTATALRDGKVLLAGGLEGRSPVGGHWRGHTLATAELYDPSSGRFMSTGSMAHPRSSHAAALLPDGRVLVLGGSDSGDWRDLDASAEVYDPATGRFAPAGRLATPRVPHGLALLPDGRALVVGGTGEGKAMLATAEMYDPRAAAFRPAGHMVTVRHKHAATALADGRVLVTGGSDDRDRQGRYDTAEVLDPATGTSALVGRMAAARFKHRSLLLTDGRVLVVGGDPRVEVFDPSTGGFTIAAGSLGGARYFPAATRLADGSVLITGGYGDDSMSVDLAFLYQP